MKTFMIKPEDYYKLFNEDVRRLSNTKDVFGTTKDAIEFHKMEFTIRKNPHKYDITYDDIIDLITFRTYKFEGMVKSTPKYIYTEYCDKDFEETYPDLKVTFRAIISRHIGSFEQLKAFIDTDINMQIEWDPCEAYDLIETVSILDNQTIYVWEHENLEDEIKRLVDIVNNHIAHEHEKFTFEHKTDENTYIIRLNNFPFASFKYKKLAYLEDEFYNIPHTILKPTYLLTSYETKDDNVVYVEQSIDQLIENNKDASE